MKVGFRVIELHKVYRNGVHALQGISFEVNEPGLYGIIGPNGAGKTTLFKIISGLIEPTKGEVIFQNHLNNSSTKRKSIGFLPEDVGIYDRLTAKQFLHIMAGLHGLKKNEREKAVLSTVELVGIDFSPGLYVRSLSTGQRKLLLLASILLHDPYILILDESLAGLDPIHREHISNVMKKLSKNKIVLFSSHILSDIWSLCDRVITINKGKIVVDDTPENIIRKITKDAYYVSFPEKEFATVKDILATNKEIEIVEEHPNTIVFTAAESLLRELIQALIQKSEIKAFGPYVPNLDKLFIRIVGD